MTLAAAFPTSAGRLPRNQQKGCNTLSTGFIALTNGSFCHTPFSLVRNPSEAAVAVLLSKVLLWGTGKGNFCLTNALWHLFQTELKNSGLVENASNAYPLCHGPRQGEKAGAGTTEPSSRPESHLRWLLLCTWVKRGRMAAPLRHFADFDKIIQAKKLKKSL